MNRFDVALRIYLLAGLALHKIVWEILKKRQRRSSAAEPAVRRKSVSFVRLIKLVVALGLFAQICLPDIFPITSHPAFLRMIGLVLFTFGLTTAIVARIQLGRNWSDIEVGQVKQDHALVNIGMYRYIRHPIYTGDLIMLLALELCLNSWLVLAIVSIAIPTIYQTIQEEKRLAETVSGYKTYSSQTKRFIPFVV